MELVSHPPVPVQEVKHFVEQEENRRTRRLEDASDGFSPRRSCLRRRAQSLDPFGTRELTSYVDPRSLAPFPWVPCIAHEHGDPGAGNRREPSVSQKIRDSRLTDRLFSARGEVVKGRQRVCLTAAELGD